MRALVEKAKSLGPIAGLIDATGVSPSQARPLTILKANPYGTTLMLEEFGNVIAEGGLAVVIASQSGTDYRAYCGAEQSAGYDPGRGVARATDASSRSSD